MITELTQTHQLNGIVWSPAGQALAVYGGDQLSIWTFDAMMTASTPLVLNHPGVSGIEWAKDGRSVMSMGDGKFRIWNLSAESPAVAQLDLPYNTWPNRFDWSSSGERVANVSSEGELQIWELTSENPAENPRTLPQSSVSSIAWSPDGTQLASADAESLVIWDLRTNQPLVFHYPPDYSYPPEMLEWSPDGSWIAAGVRQGGDVLLWSLAAGPSASDPLQLPHLQWALGWITWSPDSKQVAFFSGNPMMLMAAVIVWDLSGEAPTSVTLSNGDGVDVRQLTNIAWAWDSMHLAGGSPDGTVRIWNLSKDDPNANPVILFKERAVSAVHWSADGQWLVGSGEGNTRLWHLAIGYPNADPTFIPLGDHTDDVGSQSTWAPTANRLAVSNNETVTVWDQHPDYSWSAFITLNHESSVYGHQIEWSRNLTRLASIASNSDQVWVWDLSLDDPAVHAVIVPHPSLVSDIAWSSNNQSLAISGKDGSLQIWHATTDRFGAVQLRTDPIPDLDPYALYDLDWSPDGTYVSRTVSDTVWIWDLSAAQPNRQPIRLPHTNKVRAAEWSPDSQRIAAVGMDNAILVWALPVGELMSATIQLQQTPTDYTFPDTVVDPEVSLAWSPDGRWLASKNINLLQLWDLNAANPVTASILFVHEAPITALAWHPHEPYLATSSGHMLTDGQPNAEVKIQVWSLLEEEPIRQPIVLLQNEKLTSPLKLAWLADDSALVGWDQSNRQIRRWTMVQQQLIDLGCRAAGRNLSQAEWNRYFQGEAYRQTCPQWTATEQPIINH